MVVIFGLLVAGVIVLVARECAAHRRLFSNQLYKECYVCGRNGYCPVFIVGKGSICHRCYFVDNGLAHL